ncbi:hypothetical protein PDG61_23980 [Mycolicibacterium sp. BiH015]|uniref:hypothetical protein n=1 Tax=Mycolicibacterium sp. BiH015 TaxID=3018808 RepID=UPI0022E1150D|nr:hypothetical protein [Mycolicibacterium sp. BiH015]MDA2893989.1 hypothetical protein [Mycolicibacterium sp. BiH015]
MASKPALHGRYIGRVGALAVALGIGAAIAHGAAPATADDTASSSDSASTTDTTDADAPATAGPSAPDTAEDGDGADDGDADTEEAESGDEDPSEEMGDDDPRRRTKAEAGHAPAADDGESDSDTGTPTTQSVRREISAETVSTSSASTNGVANNSVATATVSVAATTSVLGTEQQLEAEEIASRTVKTLPVQLMKLVLAAGWLTTAQREYRDMGGIDWKNFWHLGRSIDEYALGAAFQQQLLNPMRPTVVTQVAPPHTWYGKDVLGSRILYDNPDTIYRFMGVNMTSTYVIRGQFTGDFPADTNFSVLTGLSGVTADNVSGRELLVEPDGSFTITVSGDAATPGQRNHLQLTPDTTLIAVRNTLSDWSTQPPMSLSIERLWGPRDSLFSQLGGFAIPGLGPMVTRSPLLTALVSLIPPMKEPPPLLRGTFAAVVMALGLGMESKYIKVATTEAETGERVQPNEFRNPTRNAEFLATQLQSAGYFELADDEALVVTIAPGNARYFTVPVTNLWTITDNYWDEQTSLNNAQSVADPDGRFTFVISPTDPGVYNWVSTGGFNKGTVSIRFQDLDVTSSLTPTVSAQRVSLAELDAVLPPTTQYVTAAARQQQLATRKAGFDIRFAH